MADDDALEGANTVGRGFLVGAAVALCTLIMLAGSSGLDPGGIAQRVVVGLVTAIVVAAYLSGLAAVFHRPARRLGLGILIGLTVMFPVTLSLVLGALMGG